MYEMAKKGREAMKAKARRLASEKDSKVDSSNFTPAEPLNADVKTGLRPISRRAYKSGGKVMGEACAPRADRRPRKAGGKVSAKEMAEEKSEAKEYAKAKINRDVKAANEEREGIKHVGGMKKGGKVDFSKIVQNKKTGQLFEKSMITGTGPTAAAAKADHQKKMKAAGYSKDDRAKRQSGGVIVPPSDRNRNTSPDYRRELERRQAPTTAKPSSAPAPTAPSSKPADTSTMTADEAEKFMRNRKSGGKVAMTLAGQKKVQREQAAASEPHRGKAQHYKKGGRTGKLGGGALAAGLMGGLLPAASMGIMGKDDEKEGKKGGGRVARKSGGRAKGKTNINIVIATKPAGDAGMPGMTPPGMPRPPGGVPVPVPPPGGMPIGAPMPMPAPAAPPQMPMPPGGPMGRKTGGRVAKQIGGGLRGGPGAPGGMGGIGAPGGPGGMGGMRGMRGMGSSPMAGMGKPAGMMGGMAAPADMGRAMGPSSMADMGKPAGMMGGMGAPIAQMPAMGDYQRAFGPSDAATNPMFRKSGGRVAKAAKSYKDMEAGAGSGEGRLQKTDIAKSGKGAPTFKRGGKVYRSYKDMDAGAGSGEGRLEKTEIQSRKR